MTSAESPASSPPPESPRHRKQHIWLAIALLLIISILHRLPPLMNAGAIDSDAAVPALEARHMLSGEWSWYLWGALV